ncbi:hypothetical protein CC80DRAFT_589258 [Byssothecium circinans]|uniref:Zn(2)-C6 fungal-type domain-containing protein n=1 Tax=Byssothecium circinans TaxID=147558 RepID=A0A6A5UBQ1_9PLEO|nr:hypothetical protein CC80DRAFT_589258 [Byssothecium circinans]
MENQPPAFGFRPILPRKKQQTPEKPPTVATRNSARSSVACESCRKKKVKCDAARPTCSACSSMSVECVYRTAPAESSMAALKRKYGELESYTEDLKGTQNAMEQVFCAMQNRPVGEATAIFKKIRAGANIHSILRHVSAGDLFLQLHVEPETRYRFEFPLKIEMPRFLRMTDNPYLWSRMYEAPFALPDAAFSSPTPLAKDRSSPYVKPYFSATIVDPRMDCVVPSLWTEVSKDNDLMRQLLRCYFSYEHQFLGCIHKDHFLNDMISGSTEHCSPLLMNAVLAFACHSCTRLTDRAHHWDPQTLGYKFFAEARRLWELEKRRKKSLTTVQAVIIFNGLSNVNCVDKIGLAYKDRAVNMIHELGLHEAAIQSQGKGGRDSRAFTLWAIYFWISLQDFHFRSSTPNFTAPTVALPNPDESSEWYSEFFVRYPQDSQPHSTNYGHVFKAKCELAVIMNAVRNKLFAGEQNPNKRPKVRPSEVAATFIQDLQTWFAALPVSLLPGNIVFPAQLQLHILYQDVMAVLCEKALADTTASIFGSPRTYTQSLLAYSKMCFETLVRLYYLRHGFEGCDSYLIQDLQVLAYLAQNRLNAATKNTAGDAATDLNEARATLFLAAKGLHIQGKNYYLALALSHILQNDLRPEEAVMLYRYTDVQKEDGAIARLKPDHIQAQYPVWAVAKKDRAEKSPGLGEVMENLVLLSIASGS